MRDDFIKETSSTTDFIMWIHFVLFAWYSHDFSYLGTPLTENMGFSNFRVCILF